MRPAGRKRAGHPRAQFHRIRARRGAKKAVRAVAASLLTAADHMLATGTLYRDLGGGHFDERAQGNRANRLVRRLTDLGYAAEIKPLAAAA